MKRFVEAPPPFHAGAILTRMPAQREEILALKAKEVAW